MRTSRDSLPSKSEGDRVNHELYPAPSRASRPLPVSDNRGGADGSEDESSCFSSTSIPSFQRPLRAQLGDDPSDLLHRPHRAVAVRAPQLRHHEENPRRRCTAAGSSPGSHLRLPRRASVLLSALGLQPLEHRARRRSVAAGRSPASPAEPAAADLLAYPERLRRSLHVARRHPQQRTEPARFRPDRLRRRDVDLWGGELADDVCHGAHAVLARDVKDLLRPRELPAGPLCRRAKRGRVLGNEIQLRPLPPCGERREGKEIDACVLELRKGARPLPRPVRTLEVEVVGQTDRLAHRALRSLHQPPVRLHWSVFLTPGASPDSKRPRPWLYPL